MNKERELFDLCEQLGEGVYNKVHLIYDDPFINESSFRIYHSDGYWRDIQKVEDECEFYETWEGFKESGIDFAIGEIKKLIEY